MNHHKLNGVLSILYLRYVNRLTAIYHDDDPCIGRSPDIRLKG